MAMNLNDFENFKEMFQNRGYEISSYEMRGDKVIWVGLFDLIIGSLKHYYFDSPEDLEQLLIFALKGGDDGLALAVSGVML
jgi:hypothetical protein